MALIESIIKRKKDLTVTMDDETYVFPVDGKKPYCCEVKNPTHIQRFLMITEGYKIHGADTLKAEKPKPVEDEPITVDDDTAEFDLGTLDQWSNRKLGAFAVSIGMNEKSKENIFDIAQQQYDLKLDKRKNPHAMIRQFAEALRDGSLVES